MSRGGTQNAGRRKSPARARPLTKPANAKISANEKKSAEIFACCVGSACKMRSLTNGHTPHVGRAGMVFCLKEEARFGNGPPGRQTDVRMPGNQGSERSDGGDASGIMAGKLHGPAMNRCLSGFGPLSARRLGGTENPRARMKIVDKKKVMLEEKSTVRYTTPVLNARYLSFENSSA